MKQQGLFSYAESSVDVFDENPLITSMDDNDTDVDDDEPPQYATLQNFCSDDLVEESLSLLTPPREKPAHKSQHQDDRPTQGGKVPRAHFLKQGTTGNETNYSELSRKYSTLLQRCESMKLDNDILKKENANLKVQLAAVRNEQLDEEVIEMASTPTGGKISKEVCRLFKMVELTPGDGVYITQKNLMKAKHKLASSPNC
ncbi:uncharacterized protein LOC100377820 [Saccoglossus kowalevskii]